MSGRVVCDCEEASPTAQFVFKLIQVTNNCKLSAFGFTFNAADCLTAVCEFRSDG